MLATKTINLNKRSDNELYQLQNLSFGDMHILIQALRYYTLRADRTDNYTHFEAADTMYDRLLDIYIAEEACDSVQIIAK